MIRGGCISVRPNGDGQLHLRAQGGKIELVVSEEKMESQADRLRVIAGDVLRKQKFGAGGLRLDLRFPGRVIVRPLVKEGGGKR